MLSGDSGCADERILLPGAWCCHELTPLLCLPQPSAVPLLTAPHCLTAPHSPCCCATILGYGPTHMEGTRGLGARCAPLPGRGLLPCLHAAGTGVSRDRLQPLRATRLHLQEQAPSHVLQPWACAAAALDPGLFVLVPNGEQVTSAKKK